MIAQRLPAKRAAGDHTIAYVSPELIEALAAIEPFDERPAAVNDHPGEPPAARTGVPPEELDGTDLEETVRWAIVDSNHGPPPYQSGALTD